MDSHPTPSTPSNADGTHPGNGAQRIRLFSEWQPADTDERTAVDGGLTTQTGRTGAQRKIPTDVSYASSSRHLASRSAQQAMESDSSSSSDDEPPTDAALTRYLLALKSHYRREVSARRSQTEAESLDRLEQDRGLEEQAPEFKPLAHGEILCEGRYEGAVAPLPGRAEERTSYWKCGPEGCCYVVNGRAVSGIFTHPPQSESARGEVTRGAERVEVYERMPSDKLPGTWPEPMGNSTTHVAQYLCQAMAPKDTTKPMSLAVKGSLDSKAGTPENDSSSLLAEASIDATVDSASASEKEAVRRDSDSTAAQPTKHPRFEDACKRMPVSGLGLYPPHFPRETSQHQKPLSMQPPYNYIEYYHQGTLNLEGQRQLPSDEEIRKTLTGEEKKTATDEKQGPASTNARTVLLERETPVVDCWSSGLLCHSQVCAQMDARTRAPQHLVQGEQTKTAKVENERPGKLVVAGLDPAEPEPEPGLYDFPKRMAIASYALAFRLQWIRDSAILSQEEKVTQRQRVELEHALKIEQIMIQYDIPAKVIGTAEAGKNSGLEGISPDRDGKTTVDPIREAAKHVDAMQAFPSEVHDKTSSIECGNGSSFVQNAEKDQRDWAWYVSDTRRRSRVDRNVMQDIESTMEQHFDDMYDGSDSDVDDWYGMKKASELKAKQGSTELKSTFEDYDTEEAPSVIAEDVVLEDEEEEEEEGADSAGGEAWGGCAEHWDDNGPAIVDGSEEEDSWVSPVDYEDEVPEEEYAAPTRQMCWDDDDSWRSRVSHGDVVPEEEEAAPTGESTWEETDAWGYPVSYEHVVSEEDEAASTGEDRCWGDEKYWDDDEPAIVEEIPVIMWEKLEALAVEEEEDRIESAEEEVGAEVEDDGWAPVSLDQDHEENGGRSTGWW